MYMSQACVRSSAVKGGFVRTALADCMGCEGYLLFAHDLFS